MSFHTFFCMTFHIIRSWRWKLFSFLRGNSCFKHHSVIGHNIFAYFTLSLSAVQVCMIKEMYWFSQINFCIDYFSHRSMFWFCPDYLMSSTYTEKSLSSQEYYSRIFSSCLSQNSNAKGWPYRFRSKGTTASSILDHDFLPFVSWQSNPNVWTFQFWNFQ